MNPTGFSNPQAIAEDKVLQYFRESGVFTPPKESMGIPSRFYSRGVSQTLNFEMMLLAVVRMYRSEGHGDPRVMQRMLIKCLEDNVI